MTHFSDKPMAAEGLISYRYQSQYGWCMIGATDDDDALVQASRSCGLPVVFAKLQIWNGSKYVPVGIKNEQI